MYRLPVNMRVLHTSLFTKKRQQHKLEGKYSLESTDPRESEIRAPPQPLPYLMPIPQTDFFITEKIITAFWSLGLGSTSHTY